MVEPKYYNTAGHPRIGSTTSAPENNLSAAAQEVLTAAICDGPELEYRIAAALRAAADQVVPKDKYPSSDWTDKDEVRYQLLAIAAELEGNND
jgi:hypothetical protein